MRQTFTLLLIAAALSGITSCGSSVKQPAAPKGIIDSAAAALEEINVKLRNSPANADLYVARAKYFMNKKDFDPALLDLQRALAIDSSKAGYYIMLADLYFFTNKTGSSKSALEKCLRLDPRNADGIMKLAELYYYVRKYDKSLQYLDEALNVDQYNAKAYFMKGMNFKETGDTSKAISSMQTAVEQDNNYYNAYIQLGLLCASQKNKLAEDYYKNALRIQPESTEALYDLGIYFQQQQDWKRATEAYNQLLLIDKNSFDAEYNLGVISVSMKAFPDAITHFTNAIGMEPKNARGFYGRASAYQKAGNIQNAAADYRYALTLDPDFEPAKDGLKQMNFY